MNELLLPAMIILLASVFRVTLGLGIEYVTALNREMSGSAKIPASLTPC